MCLENSVGYFNILLCETDIRQIEFGLMRSMIELTGWLETGAEELPSSLTAEHNQVEHGRQDVVSIRDRANVARNISKSESGYFEGLRILYGTGTASPTSKEQTLENAMEGRFSRKSSWYICSRRYDYQTGGLWSGSAGKMEVRRVRADTAG